MFDLLHNDHGISSVAQNLFGDHHDATAHAATHTKVNTAFAANAHDATAHVATHAKVNTAFAAKAQVVSGDHKVGHDFLGKVKPTAFTTPTKHGVKPTAFADETPKHPRSP